MAKRRCAPTTYAPGQGSFFDPPRAPASLAGFGMSLREELTATLAAAKERGLDRHDVAAAIGREDPERGDVSKHMLDRYCAASAQEWRLPAEMVPAIVRVTGDPRILMMLVEASGYRAVPDEAAAIAELATLELEERVLKARKAELQKALPRETIEWVRAEAARRSGR